MSTLLLLLLILRQPIDDFLGYLRRQKMDEKPFQRSVLTVFSPLLGPVKASK
jgi:hypothetical protein